MRVNTAFSHVHSSSLYSASLESLERALNKYTDVGSIVTFTEVAERPREKKLAEVEKWGVKTGDLSLRDDCGVIWDKSEWKLVSGGTKIVLPSMFFTESGKPVDPGAAVWVVLEHKATGKRLLTVVFHFPSSVEAAGRWSKVARRVQAWQTAHKNLRALWNEKAREFKVDGVMLVADWNVDIKKSSWRELIKRLQPAMSLVWGNGPFPDGGTHGNRLIDFTYIRGDLKPVGKPSLMPDDNSSDHRPYKETLSWQS